MFALRALPPRRPAAASLQRRARVVHGRLDRDVLPHLPALLREIPGPEARRLEARLTALWQD